MISQLEITRPGVYLIRNKSNGNTYVGSAKNIKKRWYGHRDRLTKGKHHNPLLQKDWNLCGGDSFEFLILEYVQDTSELLMREQSWLDYLRAGKNARVYNFCPRAGSHLGAKRTMETRKKLSEAMKGKTASIETRAKQRMAKLGRKLSPEHCAKLSIARKGFPIKRPKGIYGYSIRKFTGQQVIKMRRMKKEGYSYSQIESSMNVTRGSLIKILKGQTYCDVPFES